jgi:hypothetical protein
MSPNVLVEHRVRIVEPIASAVYLITQGLQLPLRADANFIK